MSLRQQIYNFFIQQLAMQLEKQEGRSSQGFYVDSGHPYPCFSYCGCYINLNYREAIIPNDSFVIFFWK